MFVGSMLVCEKREADETRREECHEMRDEPNACENVTNHQKWDKYEPPCFQQNCMTFEELNATCNHMHSHQPKQCFESLSSKRLVLRWSEADIATLKTLRVWMESWCLRVSTRLDLNRIAKLIDGLKLHRYSFSCALRKPQLRW